MSTPDESAKYNEQTSELYRAIGESAVKFEHMNRALQMGISSLLESAGLTHQQMAQVI